MHGRPGYVCGRPRNLVADVSIDADSHSTDAVGGNQINATPRPSLSFLNLFSGPYDREDGLSNVMSTFGWDRILNFDNDDVHGGGWRDDLLNDSRYVEILQQAHAGAFDVIMAAFIGRTVTVIYLKKNYF